MKSTIENELDDLLLEGLPDLVSPSALAGKLSLPLGISKAGATCRISRWLADNGAVRHRRYTKDPSKAVTLWSMRDHERYATMGPAARVAAYRGQNR